MMHSFRPVPAFAEGVVPACESECAGEHDARCRQRQSGVAAIELSLTLVILLMIIFAIVGYGALFWVKQSMNTVAADTARHVLLQSYTTPAAAQAVVTDARTYACSAAQQLTVLRAFTDVAPQGACGADFAAVNLEGVGACAVAAATAFQCLTTTLKLTTRNWPLMNTLSKFAAALSTESQGWVPDQLSSTATVLIAPAPPNP